MYFRAYTSKNDAYFKNERRLPTHHRPTGFDVDLVVFVLPRRTAAVAAVLGDGDQAVWAFLLTVFALLQLGMAGGTAPVALNAGA